MVASWVTFWLMAKICAIAHRPRSSETRMMPRNPYPMRCGVEEEVVLMDGLPVWR